MWMVTGILSSLLRIIMILDFVFTSLGKILMFCETEPLGRFMEKLWGDESPSTVFAACNETLMDAMSSSRVSLHYGNRSPTGWCRGDFGLPHGRLNFKEQIMDDLARQRILSLKDSWRVCSLPFLGSESVRSSKSSLKSRGWNLYEPSLFPTINFLPCA